MVSTPRYISAHRLSVTTETLPPLSRPARMDIAGEYQTKISRGEKNTWAARMDFPALAYLNLLAGPGLDAIPSLGD